MTLRIIDGYDWLPSSTNVADLLDARGYLRDTNNIYSSTDTAFGYGKCIQWGISSSGYLMRPFPLRYTDVDTLVVGFRFKLNGVTADGRLSIGFFDTFTSGSSRQCYLHFDTGNTLTFRTADGTAITRTVPDTYLRDRWAYMEIKVKPGTGTSGSFEVRINTVPVISVPACATVGGTLVGAVDHGINGFDWYYTVENGNLHWDDFYQLDDQGTENTDYLGNVRVKCQLAISDDTISWNIGGSSPAATNWQSVLNYGLNDTKYVYSSVVNDYDLYNMDPNLNTPYVYGIEVSSAFRQDDATQRTAATNVKIGSTTINGASYEINQDYSFYGDVYEINPGTGVSFTGAELNTLKLGPKVIV